MKTEPNLCINCEHYYVPYNSWLAFPECHREKTATPDLINGGERVHTMERYCESERENRFPFNWLFLDRCGHQGRYFKQKTT